MRQANQKKRNRKKRLIKNVKHKSNARLKPIDFQDPLFFQNDPYKTIKTINDIRTLLDETEFELNRLYSPSQIKNAAVYARKYVKQIRELAHKLFKDIQKNKQDIDSEY